MIIGIHHVAISTPDLERASHFYRDVLGFEEGLAMSWKVGDSRADEIVGVADSAARGVLFSGNNIYIEIWEYSSPAVAGDDAVRRSCDHGLAHFSLDVVDI